jgi:hypothetical protein
LRNDIIANHAKNFSEMEFFYSLNAEITGPRPAAQRGRK